MIPSQERGKSYGLALHKERSSFAFINSMQFLLQLPQILQSPRLPNGSLQHERVASTLSKAQELNHESAVVAICVALLEELVEVGAKAVLGLGQ